MFFCMPEGSEMIIQSQCVGCCRFISRNPEWIGHGLDLNTLQMPLAEDLPDVSSVV